MKTDIQQHNQLSKTLKATLKTPQPQKMIILGIRRVYNNDKIIEALSTTSICSTIQIIRAFQNKHQENSRDVAILIEKNHTKFVFDDDRVIIGDKRYLLRPFTTITKCRK